MLSNDDLIEYMYQHVQFDEIPFDSDPLYDHRQIYSMKQPILNTAYMKTLRLQQPLIYTCKMKMKMKV